MDIIFIAVIILAAIATLIALSLLKIIDHLNKTIEDKPRDTTDPDE